MKSTPRILLFCLCVTVIASAWFLWRLGERNASYLQKKTGAVSASSCQVDARSKVTLCWNADESIFPDAKEYAMSATPLSQAELKRSRQVMQQVLSRYPVAVLHNNLKTVFLVSTLHFSGIAAAGTYGSDQIYIANEGEANGFTDEQLAQTAHQEFSSILLWRHPEYLDKAAWRACNPPGFHYSGDGVASVKSGEDSTELDPNLWKKGFLNQYSLSEVEEDFNEMVSYLFTCPPSRRTALTTIPRLRRKAALVEKFYRKFGMDIDVPTTSAR